MPSSILMLSPLIFREPVLGDECCCLFSSSTLIHLGVMALSSSFVHLCARSCQEHITVKLNCAVLAFSTWEPFVLTDAKNPGT